jgi:hypothetical protein
MQKMADNKDLFNGLDSLVFDNTESIIDVSSFSKKVDEPDGSTETTKDDSIDDKSTVESEEDQINPLEFFEKAKVKEAEGTSEDDLEADDSDNAGTGSPEEALKGWVDYFKENTLLEEEDLEGFDGSVELLQEAFKKREVRLGLEMVEDYKSQLPAEIKVLADNWEEGVPLNELINIKYNQIR